MLASLADHAAIALENARLFQRSERSLQKLRAANSRAESYNDRLEQAAELHQSITEMVAAGASLDEVTKLVGKVLDGHAMIADSDGLPLSGFGDALDPVEVKQLIATSDAAGAVGHELASASGQVLRLALIRTKATHLGFLIFAGRALDESDVRTLERAALVTALLLLDIRAHDEARGRLMTEFFGELANSTMSPRSDAAMLDRLKLAGLRIAEGPYVVFAAICSSAPTAGSLRAHLAGMAESQGGLTGMLGGHAVLLLPGRDAHATAVDLACTLTKKVAAPVTVGAAGPYKSLVETALAHVRAVNCAKVLVTVGRTGQGATSEQLGLYTLLFSDVTRQQIEAFVSEILAPVVDYDRRRDADLVHTLEAYYESGSQKGRIAELLFVHVNTLYQRFERLDSLLGTEWRRGEGALQVHLALRLSRLLERTM